MDYKTRGRKYKKTYKKAYGYARKKTWTNKPRMLKKKRPTAKGMHYARNKPTRHLAVQRLR